MGFKLSKSDRAAAVEQATLAALEGVKPLAQEFFRHAHALESGPARVAAIGCAGRLLAQGVTVRQASKLAGSDAAETGAQRHFTVAKAMVTGKGFVSAPEGFTDWQDAIGDMSIRALCGYIREIRNAGKPVPEPLVTARKAMRGLFKSIGKHMETWNAADVLTEWLNGQTDLGKLEQVVELTSNLSTDVPEDVVATVDAPPVETVNA